MKIALGTDERTPLTDFVVEELRARGFDVELCGAQAPKACEWPDVAQEVAERVAQGLCDEGILFCWTGTGVSIAANKVPGIRAALCSDAQTAAGARRWNHANVLVMGLRLTSNQVAKEILDAWFNTPPEDKELEHVAKVAKIEQKYAVPRSQVKTSAPLRKTGKRLHNKKTSFSESRIQGKG
ncbi:MAG: RpiB/LacA/LacB family sugar-phosphate isomerase [Chloroflexi bacterium]|nr:RpiB/LacA/LacB family sugar-phosphate isomerase [Chloroflexota bacterium]